MAYEPGVLRIVDQTKLPGELDVLSLTSAGEVASAIREMRVRGAPAIGIAGAYGLAIAALQSARKADSPDHFLGMLADAAQTLEAARPTAVNLAWAVHGLLNEAKRHVNDGVPPEAVAVQLQKEAKTLHADDIAACRRIGDAGAPLLPRGANVLTHCNTGDFATGGYGTALGVIRSAWRAGALRRVYVDETRPALQGARLTTYELDGDRIPYTLITDGMAGHFMRRGDIGAVIVGADRIAANGDTANKIGTYALAVLAREHDIPFYVAAPRSTFDPDAQTGDDIPIEERSAGEVRAVQGVPIAPADAPVANPAFDVTPARYITAFITDAGVLAPPFDAAIAALGKAGAAAPATAKT
ncbi:MAG: S-methyl-5-thioribose-1-phosphate isomerase [Candidatus Eremiobacteraeota bacterium]|nr:S-methyl-5-thioribose-1-phosphate isomerase [Candidatus Eremiobacteraeota bacterium]MBV8365198.1 S-methyl-5-thioribose-1-phosphate isomerase [Candidatus Eremiobacteraeota bacterium]